MIPVTALNAIFSTSKGPASNICEMLCDTRLSLVSKAFHRANLQAMEQVAARLQFRGNKVSADQLERAWSTFPERDQPPEEIADALLLEMDALADQLDRLAYPDFELIRKNIADVKTFIIRSASYHCCLREENALDHLVIFLSLLKSKIQSVQGPQQDYDPLLVKNLQEHVREFLKRCSLNSRLKCAVGNLSLLHEFQEHVAVASTEFAKIEREERYSFSPDRFMRAEVAALEGKGHVFARQRFEQSIDGYGDRSTIERATFHGYTPADAGALTGLRVLRWEADDFPLTTLPHWIENFQQLKHLTLAGHRFTEIPPALEQLPLTHVSLTGNQLPIRVFPEWLYESYGFFQLAASQDSIQLYKIAEAFCIPTPLQHPRSYGPYSSAVQQFYLDLPYTEFTDIPFRAWFGETIRIPNIVAGCADLLWQLGYAIHAYSNNLPYNSLIHDCPGLPILVYGVVFGIPIILLSLLGIAWTFVNGALNFLLEPPVTFFRDLLDYNRMVHVRDIPAQREEA